MLSMLSMTQSGSAAWSGTRRAIGALLIWLASQAAGWAAEPTTLTGCARQPLDGRHLEVAELPAGNEGLARAVGADFRPLEGRSANFGATGGSVWLRLTVPALDCDEPMVLQLGNPFTNRTRIFRETPGVGWVEAAVDARRLRAGVDDRLRYAMLPLELERGQDTRFLVEVGGPSSVLVRPAIVAAGAVQLQAIQRGLLGGLLAGGVVALSIYCALLGLMTRFRGLIAFAVSSLALASFYGLTAGLLDPFVVWLAGSRLDPHDTVLRLDGMFVLTAGLFHWFFVRGLLGGGSAPEDGGVWGRAALGAWAALIFVVPFVEGPVMAMLCVATALVAIGAIVVEVAVAVRQKHPLARVIVTATGALSLSVLGFIGLYMGVLPWHPALLHAVAIGTLIEAMLLSVAVGTHVKDLRGQQQRLTAKTHELSLLSQIDPLTGLGNRRAYDSIVPVELERCQRRGRTASLLVVDIDHFKQINDAHGHGFGDSVIRMLGATIANSVRSTDQAFRYGGEEFVVLLPGLDSVMGQEVAERIMREFTNCSPTAPDGTRPFFSVSIGLAQLNPGDDPSALFGRADAAMYRAKQEGRCRTVVADAPRSPTRTPEQVPA